ncbi:hypothetical protein GCM10023235_14890 [Kitasatospora terrestris]|uniref:Uncharacterized protein n=1 Tax=Kitasatospora terrestris TaxID=258051 RepID=A0ABP9DFD6_9ACTN
MDDRSPEHFLEDVDLARLAAGRITGHQTPRQGNNLDLAYLPAAFDQPSDQCGDDIGHGGRMVGCHVEVLAEPVGQPVGLTRLPIARLLRARRKRTPTRP